MRIDVQLGEIADWESFHAVFARDLRFFDGYGRNMNAWIDCMSDWSHPGTVGLMRHEVPEGEDLALMLRDAEAFLTRLPEIAGALWDATGFVNRRFHGAGLSSRLLLAPH